MPANTPILATTATANDRAITDIENQISGLITIRGNLKRELFPSGQYKIFLNPLID